MEGILRRADDAGANLGMMDGGLGTIGTAGQGTGIGQGFGSGHGRLVGSSPAKPPQAIPGTPEVKGLLPREVIERIARQNTGRYRLCYENGLRTDPTLAGRVVVKFTIDGKGDVKTASDSGSDLPAAAVVTCVVRAFSQLSFPSPESGEVKVTYPVLFSPGG